MFFENIKEAFTNILSNKMRSILTMLGIIIGISAVITITTIGSSIQNTLSATMNSLGGNTISLYIEPRYPEDDAAWDTWVQPEMEEKDYISQEMIDGLIEEYPDEFTGIVASNYLGAGQVKKDEKTYANVSVNGVTPSYMEFAKLKMYAGRNITEADNTGRKRVCVIADTMAANYFGDQDPIGETIEFTSTEGSTHSFVVVGVYEYNVAMFGQVDTSVPEKDRSTTVFVPVQTTFKLTDAEQSGYGSVDLMLTALADSDQALADAQTYFENLYADNKNFQASIFSMASQLGMINTVINVITIAISFIAAISLIVGGVGVMNIMLVSITERTREIGVRMALGAKRRTIRMQFVIEAIVLCLIGGIIGIIIGIAFGMLIGQVAQFLINTMYTEYSNYIIMSVKPSVTAIMLSLLFSMLTGVFFGYYPANKAAKMEVIDALRYE